ncbi:Crp/Fnr family transcriptional regulator [Shimazuella sp. AN120528]|uniref:Crp/Fnr family transcriptional regulator n=1 Tax=Shimazuella soli TaxID=1892854 RepID=UPI001F10FB3F|nr:Crp/Fnr family transcriptional regulator [Shimazuella soli]MCH5586517.1 Crp/Fnr family transcriptional regulator [Shimazuella soli]
MQKKANVSMWIEHLQFDWSPFYSRAKIVTLSKHQTLFDQEEEINQIYVVVEGRIRLSIINKLGEEKAIMIIGKNGIVGDLGLYATNTYLTSAVPVTSCKLLSFSAIEFQRLLLEYPALLSFYLFNLDKKFLIMTSQIVELSYQSARFRVLQLLIQLAQTYGAEVHNGIRIAIRFTQQEMANVAGTSRVTVAQVFRQLRKERILTKENGYIILSSIGSLVRLQEKWK